MKYLWLYCLPLLFLPNLGFETATPFGTLTVSDYFIGPYLILVFLRYLHYRIDRFKPKNKLYVHYLMPTFLVFLWWAIISTLTIYYRYGYPNLDQTYFGLLKLGKLSLYGVAAFYTIRALSKADEHEYQGYLWAMLVSGFLVGSTLLASGNSLQNILPSLQGATRGEVFYQNPISAMMAMIIIFFVALLIQGNGTNLWRGATLFCLIIMILGFTLAEGRGGWIAAIVGMVYLASKINLKHTIRVLLVGTILIIFTYNQFPTFQRLIDLTLQPDSDFIETYDAGIFGFNTIDAGSRPRYWLTEGAKISHAPLLGTGFFHRGGLSGIDRVGSHNFFLQMFLETGIPGGLLILLVFRQMWKHASTEYVKISQLDLPIKAALVVAIVSGFSGEYFYGGMVLFTLLLIYAPVGAIIAQD